MSQHTCLAIMLITIATWSASPNEHRLLLATPFAERLPMPDTDRHIVVQTHLYIACVDVEARQPAWVAYVVNRSDWDTRNVLERNFHTPRELRDVLLEQADYAGSGFDLGHCYGLQFVSACQHASEVNSLAVIAAQRAAINRGPMLAIENHIKALSIDQPVYVLNGQLWLDEMPDLPNANEPHRVASHLFVLIQAGGTEEAFLVPQNSAELSDPLRRFSVPVEELREQVSSSWVETSLLR